VRRNVNCVSLNVHESLIPSTELEEKTNAREKKENGSLVAVKFIKIFGNDNLPPHLIREMSILSSIQHQNIVSLLAVYLEVPLFICELLEMDLRNLLQSTQKCGLPEADIARFSSHIIAGLDVLHLRWVVHRDLKPSNICISRNRVAKICDFRSARATCIDTPVPYTREATTLFYRAPELILGSESYSFPVDMWALGCILAEMILGYTFFPSSSEIGMIFEIFRKLGTPDSTIWPGLKSLPRWRQDLPCFPVPSQQKYNKERDDVDDLGFELMFSMLRYNPSHRLTAQSALHHPFVRGVR